MELVDVLSLLAGAVGVPLINLIKGRFNLGGNAALALSLVVSVALAVVGLLYVGELSADGLLAIGAQVFGTSQLVYQFIQQN